MGSVSLSRKRRIHISHSQHARSHGTCGIDMFAPVILTSTPQGSINTIWWTLVELFDLTWHQDQTKGVLQLSVALISMIVTLIVPINWILAIWNTSSYPGQNTECHPKLQYVMSSHVDNMMSIYMYNTVFPRITNMVCALFWFVAVSHKKRLILPTFVMITSLALGQSYHWPSARKATLKNNGKCITQNHRSSWWRHQMETLSALLAICAGNSPVPGEFPAQRPVTRSFDVFFDLRPNKRLSK